MSKSSRMTKRRKHKVVVQGSARRTLVKAVEKADNSTVQQVYLLRIENSLENLYDGQGC